MLEFTIDLTRLDNIDDETVSCVPVEGKIQESDVEKCKLECPREFSFVSAFIENCCSLLKQLEEKKKVALSKIKK